MGQQSKKKNISILKQSQFLHIDPERMEHCRKKHMEVPEETLNQTTFTDCRYQSTEAGRINTLVLDAVEKEIHEGMTTQDIDDLVARVTKELEASVLL